MKPPAKPLLIYDGDCGFCRGWIARWKRIAGDGLDVAPSQQVAASLPDIPPEVFEAAVVLVEPDGRWSQGAEAVFRSLATATGGGAWLAAYQRLPGFAAVSELAYRLVARHRDLFSVLTRWLWGRHLVPPGEALTSWIFLRLLGAVFGVAFLSLWVQIIGLSGSRGILPAAEYLNLAWAQRGLEALWLVPSVFWLHPGDLMLHLVCAAGTVCALALALGVAPIVSAGGCWVLYLSLASIAREFLWFQWDGLLLEAGFLAVLLSSWRWWSRPRGEPQPPRIVVWLLRWLVFRLMLSSAIVKITSGDPTWRNLTALDFHFFTQPLPTWTAWYVHQLPAYVRQFMVGGMFAIEGLAPFLIFTPRRLRIAGAGLLISLQLGIAATGNYGFFNLLSIVLCVMLLDDGVWPRAWRERLAAHVPVAPTSSPARAPRRWPRSILVPTAALLFLASLVPLAGTSYRSTAWLGPIDGLYRFISPFRTVNRYGLFAVMTTERPEIIIEGSRDGLDWTAYAFRWKPGDVKRRPGFVAPHMPRLDWQMWFAALRDVRSAPWFLSFAKRLLEGSPPVIALLERDPFPGGPPRYLRAVVYDYRFSTPSERAESGAWWVRAPLRLYCPVLTLENGELAAVSSDSLGNIVAR